MSLAEAAKAVYERDLRGVLEANHWGEYVAIEPESGAHYVAKTFLEAAFAARAAQSCCESAARKPFVLRIGHEAAFHLGACSK